MNRLVPSSRRNEEKRKRTERCRIFSLEFLEMVSGQREATKILGEGGAVCEKFPLSMAGQWGRGRARNSYDLYANRSASLFVPLIRSIVEWIDPIGLSSFGEERWGRESLSRRRRWGELMLGGRCISVITEWPVPPPRVPDTRLPFSNIFENITRSFTIHLRRNKNSLSIERGESRRTRRSFNLVLLWSKNLFYIFDAIVALVVDQYTRFSVLDFSDNF